MHEFPKDFLWGVATSAPQIEGGVEEGGRGESIWDRFAATPGKIEDGSSPRVACDHFHRWRDDIRRMQWLGIGAYRFSIAWPRVLPTGRGRACDAGLDFYDALVDGLLEAGIRPFVTLNHWDLPQALQDRGGWSSRRTVDAFVHYASVVSRRLGDRVPHWVTHNEPWCMATLGYEEGHHAPGHLDPAEGLRAGHHLLLSHGLATQAVRQNAPAAEVGIVLNLTPALPATPSADDVDAVRRVDGLLNRWFLDPLYRGRYPADVVADRVRRGHLADTELSFVQPGDMATIAAPLDFLGLNFYSRITVRAGDDGEPVPVRTVPESELTDMGWEVHPEALHGFLLRIRDEYAPPRIYITENGAAYADGPDATGHIADDRRVEYLRGHLRSALRARADGVPLAGYFAWSLLDNFEWAHGYARRFGLFWVDFVTQDRIAKESAYWYRDVVATGSLQVAASPHASRRMP